MIIAMAGLPGTGKSTLAAALAERLGAKILSKDAIREAIFGPDHVDYSRTQDDLCMDVVYAAMAYLLSDDPRRTIIIDGRTFSQSGQAETLVRHARKQDQPLLFVRCECDEQTALARLQSPAGQSHPAKNRSVALYRKLAASRVTVPHPSISIDTGTATVTEAVGHVVSACVGLS